MRSVLAAALALAAVPCFASNAPSAPSCEGAEFKQLDFWLGSWNAKWEGGNGSNLITKTYGGCVIEEHFNAQPSQHLQGHSVSTYVAASKIWRQTWVDNEDGYIDLSGGPDGKGNFVLTTLPVPGSAKASRMIFTAIKPDSFTWRWQKTVDGIRWADSWVIFYTRQKS